MRSADAVHLREAGRLADFSTVLNTLCESFYEQNVHGLFEMAMTRRISSRHSAGTTAQSPIMPTPERRQHGVIERLDRPIADESGGAGRPYRTVDTLAVMERRGSITAAMRRAGDDFRARFATAQLDPLRALDYSRPRNGSGGQRNRREEPNLRVEGAREAVWRAVLAVGGLGSPGGSCLWHVVGWERSLKEWSVEQGWSGRRVSQEAASGILIAALGALEAHYRHGNTL
jgi:uncharacterized protein DUF6456